MTPDVFGGIDLCAHATKTCELSARVMSHGYNAASASKAATMFIPVFALVAT